MASRAALPESGLAAAGVVGQWEINSELQALTLDGPGAAFIYGDGRMEGVGLSVEQSFSVVHDDDRALALEACRTVMASGGPFLIQGRAVLPKLGLRHIQMIGSFSWNDRGVMIGRGILIDVTAFVAGVQSGEPAMTKPVLAVPPRSVADPLMEAADKAMETRLALGRSGHGALRLAADLLLFEINTALAERHVISDKPVPGLQRASR